MDSEIFSQICQVGVIVKDLDKTVAALSSLGIGPFEPLPGKPFGNRKIRGQPANYKMKIKHAQVGAVQLELLQPLEGESVQKEFLEKRGEGIHHLGFFAKDIDKKVAELKKKGIKVLSSASGKKKGGFAYLDTEALCGFVLELVEWDVE